MFFEPSGAVLTPRETAVERLIRTPIRTNNRIRSPRLAASGPYDNVGKGSRQISSVTLGKGMALRADCRGLSLDSPAE